MVRSNIKSIKQFSGANGIGKISSFLNMRLIGCENDFPLVVRNLIVGMQFFVIPVTLTALYPLGLIANGFGGKAVEPVVNSKAAMDFGLSKERIYQKSKNTC